MQTLRSAFSKVGLLLTICGGVLLTHRAEAAVLCTDLPPSTLQIYDIKAPAPRETSISKNDLERFTQPGDLVSRHTRMLSVADLVTWLAATSATSRPPAGES